MTARHAPAPERFDAEFQYPIYSPKGGIEGALLHAGNEPVQLVFEPHGGAGAEAFAGIARGDAVSVQASAEPLSDKGDAAHAVYRFERLLAVNGRAPAGAAETGARAPYVGTVVRLNYARHGAANGVVLDSGHFIHTRPEGMARLQLGVGDRVEADGAARPLAGGAGQAVEAAVVNGRAVGKAAKHG